MKSGYLILLCMLMWLVSQILVDRIWIHQLMLSTISLAVAIGASLYWLSKNGNRKLLVALGRAKSGSEMVKAFTSGSFLTSMTGTALVAIVFIQALRLWVMSTEEYTMLVDEVESDQRVINELGEIRVITLGTNYNYSSKDTHTELNVSLMIFGKNWKEDNGCYSRIIQGHIQFLILIPRLVLVYNRVTQIGSRRRGCLNHMHLKCTLAEQRAIADLAAI